MYRVVVSSTLVDILLKQCNNQGILSNSYKFVIKVLCMGKFNVYLEQISGSSVFFISKIV